MNAHRERALGANEAMFRRLNELLNEVARRGGVPGEIVFLCECGDDACAEEIDLHPQEYERVRAVDTHFVVRPGHFAPEVEIIVAQNDRYWIVEKTGEAAEVAEDTDPR